jgi:hypothetical protein
LVAADTIGEPGSHASYGQREFGIRDSNGVGLLFWHRLE